jgi:methyltransferase (TIGR00027 family)
VVTEEDMRTQVMGTARWIAAARARESVRADRLFDDPWAAQLAGRQGVEMLVAREAGGQQNGFLPVRTRFFDDVLAAACRPAGQVVLLGAGLDTRAWRLRLPARTTVFELDYPEVLGAKVAVLRESDLASERRAVPGDLRADWVQQLMAAGFDPTCVSVWIAEGVLFYLTSAQVDDVLAGAATLSAPGSVFAADTFGTGLLRLPSLRALVEHRARSGAALPFCTDEPRELLARAGWRPESILDLGAPGANFGRLAPIPSQWDGGSDPSMRTYLLVGSRQVPAGLGAP